MIQLTPKGPVFERDAAWERASRIFAERHYMVLPQFVEGSLLQRITRPLAKSEFVEREDKHEDGSVFAREVALGKNTPVPRLFHLLLNNQLLFAAIQELVDCGPTASLAARTSATAGSVASKQAAASSSCLDATTSTLGMGTSAGAA